MTRDIRKTLASRLGQRLGLTIFALILAIEIAIFVPSVLNFRADMLREVEARVRGVADAGLTLTRDTGGAADPDAVVRLLLAQPGVHGAAVFTAGGGKAARGGEAVGISPADMPGSIGGNASAALRQVLADDNRMEIAWYSAASGENLLLVARLDRQDFLTAVVYFGLRIGGLVAIIIIFTAIGTMIALHRMVLGPVLAVRQSMQSAAAAPDRADAFVLDPAAIGADRGDELSDVVDAHNDMLERIADSRRAEQARAREEALWLTRHEPTTGLPNRAYLTELLAREVTTAGRAEATLAVLAVDIVRFRHVNDAHGPEIGDLALQQIGRRLQDHLRPGDHVGRIGGDVFAIVLAAPQTAESAGILGGRLLESVAAPLALAGETMSLRGRVGIALYPSDGGDAAALLHAAELALTGLKSEPSAQMRFAAPELTREARERQALERDLARAIEAGELELFYQPKLALGAEASADRIAGAEALIRWRHPEKGLVSPGLFIPVAETSGLIHRIGHWVIGEACRQIAAWKREGLPVPRVAVNLSAQQFAEAELPDFIARSLADHGLDASCLELEITETVAMASADRTAATIEALKAQGLTLSIDDFGTGYSSLSYLKRFAVDTIKIDQSFIRPLALAVGEVDAANREGGVVANGGAVHGVADSDPAGRERDHAAAISEAVLGLGRALGKKVVAEGVETEHQLAFLRASGCNEVQGYLISRPVPAAAFGKLLTSEGQRAAA